MLVGLIAATTFLSISLFLWGLLHRRASAMAARMDSFRQQAIMSVEETDLSVPFSDRVIGPTMEGMARMATSILPASVLASIEKQLVTAGNPMTVNGFATFWVTLTMTFGGFALLVAGAAGLGFGIQQVFMVVLLGMFGFVLPILWLRGRVKARQRLILRALPDAMDLITTCVEAGLGLDAALARVAEKSSGPLTDELTRTLREVAMGRMRREALADMGNRTGVDELISFITAVIQAEQLGVSIGQVLRVQSDQLRTRRRQRAEQSAHEAPIKMIFPLVLFIFPAFMIVILGPAVIRIGQNLFQ